MERRMKQPRDTSSPLDAEIACIYTPAFAGDPRHLLPNTPVTIHSTTSAYDAYFAVAKILGVEIWPSAVSVRAPDGKPDESTIEAQKRKIAELKNIQITLNLDNATGAQALETITSFTHKPWETWPGLKAGQVLVIVTDAKPREFYLTLAANVARGA